MLSRSALSRLHDTYSSLLVCLVSVGIAIGGDTFPGSTLSDHCIRYQNIPQIKMIVVLGELGGRDEYSLVEALKAGKVTKPVVAWVSGTCATLFKSEVQFGHAGARSGGEEDSAQAKNNALKAAGAIVPESFEGLEGAVRDTYQRLVKEGVLVPTPDVVVPEIPMDLDTAVKLGKVGVCSGRVMQGGGAPWWTDTACQLSI